MAKQERFLVPIKVESTKSLQQTDWALSPEQHQQIMRASEVYLREHKLVQSYQNLTSVAPVIRSCVLEGLLMMENRNQIKREDNLFRSFKLGYDKRKNIIAVLNDEIKGLTGESTYEGPLALKGALVLNSIVELANIVKMPFLSSGQTLAEVVQKRKPHFEQLVEFCAAQVEVEFPESRKQKLTVEQSAGLIRNLIFTRVVSKSNLPLLETEDIMQNAAFFLDEISVNRTKHLQDLAEVSALDWEKCRDYLLELSYQTEQAVKNIPQGPVKSPETLELAYKNLKDWFLVVNPFYKLSDLSEKPGDEGRSIWDTKRSTTVFKDGALYRVPLPNTLRLFSKVVAIENPSKGNQYKEAAIKMGQLLGEIYNKSIDTSVARLEAEALRAERDYTSKLEKMNQGNFESSWVIKETDLRNYAIKQLSVITDELQFVSAVRRYKTEQSNMALALLKKYKNGELLDPNDLEQIKELVEAPSRLSRRMLYFLRERVENRVRNLSEIAASSDIVEATKIFISPGFAQSSFENAVGLTVIDLLKRRSEIWLEIYREEELNDLEKLVIWRFALERQKVKVNGWVRNEITRFYDLSDKKERKRAEKKRRKLLGSTKNHIGRTWATIREQERQIDKGVIPEMSLLPVRSVDHLYERRLRDVDNALASWQSELRVSQMESKLPSEPVDQDLQHSLPPKFLLEWGKTRYGTAKVLIGVIAKLVPDTLRPKNTLSLKAVAERNLPSEFDHPILISSRPSRRDEEKNLKRMYRENYRGYLRRMGFEWTEGRFTLLVPEYIIKDLRHNAYFQAKLFAIEGELKDWYTSLMRKLSQQMEDQQQILRTTPETILKESKVEVEAKKKDVRRRIWELNRNLDSRFRQLESLGLVLPESKFT